LRPLANDQPYDPRGRGEAGAAAGGAGEAGRPTQKAQQQLLPARLRAHITGPRAAVPVRALVPSGFPRHPALETHPHTPASARQARPRERAHLRASLRRRARLFSERFVPVERGKLGGPEYSRSFPGPSNHHAARPGRAQRSPFPPDRQRASLRRPRQQRRACRAPPLGGWVGDESGCDPAVRHGLRKLRAPDSPPARKNSRAQAKSSLSRRAARPPRRRHGALPDERKAPAYCAPSRAHGRRWRSISCARGSRCPIGFPAPSPGPRQNLTWHRIMLSAQRPTRDPGPWRKLAQECSSTPGAARRAQAGRVFCEPTGHRRQDSSGEGNRRLANHDS